MTAIVTDKPVQKTPYQVKGVFMRDFPDLDIIPMLNGKYRDRYLYPRVQVKVINEQIFIIGIGHGADSVLQLSERIKLLNFGNITFEILEKNIEENKNIFEHKDDMSTYQFLTSWAALNKNSWKTYKNMQPKEKVSFLNKLLGKNLAFISNEFKLDLPEKLSSRIKVNSIDPTSIDGKWGGFNGKFITNFNLPSFIGLGNGITRGYGTFFNTASSQLLNIDDLGLPHLEDKNNFVSDIDEININDFKKLKGKQRKRTNRSKRKIRNKSNNDNYIDNQKHNDEPNFNTESYHQKQHKI